MAESPQAKAVKTNNKDTAGPPLAAAFPIVLKIPAPTMAATPKAVRSTTLRLRLILFPLSDKRSASRMICVTDFLRNKLEIFKNVFFEYYQLFIRQNITTNPK